MRHSKFAPDLIPISETGLIASQHDKSVLKRLDGLRSRSGRSHSSPAPVTSHSGADTVRPRSVSAKAGTAAVQASDAPVVDDKYGRTILHNAVRKGDLETVRSVLAQHPELLRFPDNRGNQPLHYAVNAGTPNGAKSVYLLLKAGAFANAVNDRNQTPLLVYAISTEDDSDLVPRILLHHNAKPAVKVNSEFMLPQYVASRGLFKVAAALREYM